MGPTFYQSIKSQNSALFFKSCQEETFMYMKLNICRAVKARLFQVQSCTHGSLVLAARLNPLGPTFYQYTWYTTSKTSLRELLLSTGTRTEQYRAPSEMPVQLYKIRAQNINGIRQNPGSSWLCVYIKIQCTILI